MGQPFVSAPMSSANLSAYRSIVREVNRAAVAPRSRRTKAVATNFRKFFDQQRQGQDSVAFQYDMQNALTFMHSQRMHGVLLDRYNPLHDLTTEERIKATARRVGLDMPVNRVDKSE